jgi:hypothetical protein
MDVTDSIESRGWVVSSPSYSEFQATNGEASSMDRVFFVIFLRPSTQVPVGYLPHPFQFIIKSSTFLPLHSERLNTKELYLSTIDVRASLVGLVFVITVLAYRPAGTSAVNIKQFKAPATVSCLPTSVTIAHTSYEDYGTWLRRGTVWLRPPVVVLLLFCCNYNNKKIKETVCLVFPVQLQLCNACGSPVDDLISRLLWQAVINAKNGGSRLVRIKFEMTRLKQIFILLTLASFLDVFVSHLALAQQDDLRRINLKIRAVI